MDAAVLLRGVNVGGRKLRTAEFAADLRPLEVKNVGAAGTFAVLGAPNVAAVRSAFAERLPFQAEIVVVPRTELERLLARGPPEPPTTEPGSRICVVALAERPATAPKMPMVRPEGGPWEVHLARYDHPFVVGANLRRGDRILYANAVVEREFGVASTTRWWETLEQLQDAFSAPPAGTPARRRR